MSKTSPWITWTTSATPLAATRSWARTAIDVSSTAYTRAAPALAAKTLRMPVPAPTSRTMSPGRTTESMARRNASVRTRSRIIVRCTSNSAYIGSSGCLIGVRIHFNIIDPTGVADAPDRGVLDPCESTRALGRASRVSLGWEIHPFRGTTLRIANGIVDTGPRGFGGRTDRNGERSLLWDSGGARDVGRSLLARQSLITRTRGTRSSSRPIRRRPMYDPEPAQYAPPPVDPADEIEHLAQLHASGVLTDEEFATAKAKALGS